MFVCVDGERGGRHEGISVMFDRLIGLLSHIFSVP